MYIEMGGVYNIKGQKVFGRRIYTNVSEIETIRKRFNNTDVYATIFQYNNEDQNNSDLYGPLYIDLDMDFNNDKEYTKLKQDLARIVTFLKLHYGIPTEYIKFYFTGKKGFHLIISPIVFGAKPNKNLNVYYKEIAKELNDNTINKIVDIKIYDKKRLLRLVNSINSKTGLYKVPVTYEDIMKLSYNEMREYASDMKTLKYTLVKPVEKAINKFRQIVSNIEDGNKKRVSNIKIPTNVDFSKITFPKCIQAIFRDGVAEGNRNNTTIILSSALFQKGIDFETGLAIINKWNLEKNNPSLSDSEIKATVSSAYHQVTSGRRYGCSSIKEMDLCVGRECKLYR